MDTLTVEQKAQKKVAVLQAVAQLNMLIQVFGNAPEKVQKSAKEFRDSLQEWANEK